MLSHYICIAFGVYLGLAVYNFDSYKYADKTEIVLGILAALVFPITLYIIYSERKDVTND